MMLYVQSIVIRVEGYGKRVIFKIKEVEVLEIK
jgi:hypothetical protein